MKRIIEEINDSPVTSEEVPLDIVIHNITSSFKVGCTIDLKKIPPEYLSPSSAHQAVSLRVNGCTIVLRNSGNSLCMGASSEDQALSAAKECVELLESWEFDVSLNDYRILSFFCSCLLPWRIQVEAMVTKYHNDFMYEPEIHNYCMLKMKKGHGFFAVYSTGFIRVIGHSIEMILDILEKALPFLSEFRI